MEIFSKTFSTVLRLAQDACPWRSSAREHHLRSTRALIIQDRLFSRTLDMEYCSCSAAETSAQLLHLRSCLSRPSRRRAAGLTRGYEFAASAQPGASGAAGLAGAPRTCGSPGRAARRLADLLLATAAAAAAAGCRNLWPGPSASFSAGGPESESESETAGTRSRQPTRRRNDYGIMRD
jgi:hypothetical protein